MLKIFLSSHGHMASGIKSSLDILIGNTDKITVFDAYVDEKNVQDVLDNFYKTVSEDDEVLLLSDLYGGSVNQVMFTYLNRPNTRLVSGVNLALVLELAIKETISDSELEELVETSRMMMKIVKMEALADDNDSDEFF
ncbi:MAG: PTS sugar transporter subunit IIA [Firmicutes bacterium]|nr:PTS sugar transporter subunit IIA [Erysipelotrichaceae bacterium]MDD7227594.1 PTS sugar transporter subunit IIA [Bacillota bacterium]MDY5997257.1 PTS sugar transporter subunit IIA [Erysipelotrichaceae bacterium]